MKKAQGERQLSLFREGTLRRQSTPSWTFSSFQRMLGGVPLSKIVEPAVLRGDCQQPTREEE